MGRQAIWLTESTSIPRTTSTVEGPTHLPQTAIAVLKLCAHWDDSGGPQLWSHLGNVEDPGSDKNAQDPLHRVGYRIVYEWSQSKLKGEG